MKTRKFLIFAALLPLLLLLAGCGEKQAFNPVVFVAEHSADSLTNAAGERLQGDPELGFDNDATTMEFGELYATQLYITHLVAYEIPRTTSLTLHSQYNPVIESASTEFLLHSDAVECRLDATYAEDGELTFEIDAESCRLRGDDMEYSLMFDYGCEDKTTLTIKAAGSQEVTVTYRNGNVVIQSDTAFTLRQFDPAATRRSGSMTSRRAARSSRPPRSRVLPGNKEKDAGLAAPPPGLRLSSSFCLHCRAECATL